jgi:hypothetical protein
MKLAECSGCPWCERVGDGSFCAGPGETTLVAHVMCAFVGTHELPCCSKDAATRMARTTTDECMKPDFKGTCIAACVVYGSRI